MLHLDRKSKIAYLSTFPPRECGIATFTNDLISAADGLFMPDLQSVVYAMLTPGASSAGYNPEKVVGFIYQDKPEDFISAAKKINEDDEINLVNIQHEFGIYGSDMGKNILFFLNNVTKPVVITFHTILPEPSIEIINLVQAIAARVETIIVMTNGAAEILETNYGLPANKIKIIPHGIHSVKYTHSAVAKRKLKFSKDSFIFSTFGLLSRNKGIEYFIQAMPEILREYPNARYIIVGATHPEVLKAEGDSYRTSLEELVEKLGLQDSVIFYNKYFHIDKILDFLLATDIYVSTSLDPHQAVSGTLSYALGAGRPVISTSFAQAKALITEEVGRLVGFRNPAEFATAAKSLLVNPKLLEDMGMTAYFRTRHMVWQNVALSYMHIFSSLVPVLSERNMHLPKINFDYLRKITDANGVYQFAKLDVPNPDFGYTLDDNSRALMAALRYYKLNKDPQILKLINIYLGFLKKSLNTDGKFRNYFDKKMEPNLPMETKDSQENADSRAVLALMETIYSKDMEKSVVDTARFLLQKRLNSGVDYKSLRAMAIYCKGLSFVIEGSSGEIKEKATAEMNNYCSLLVEAFNKNHSPQWVWLEDILAYSNSIMSEALLIGYKFTGNKEYLDVGVKTLEFLLEKTFIDGIYMPIGQNGWYIKNGKRAYYDQQPEDVYITVQTLAEAYEITKEEKFKKMMFEVFYWFLGSNSLGQVVYDFRTGGCYDGLGERSINLNMGAESTVSYLLARLRLEDFKGSDPAIIS